MEPYPIKSPRKLIEVALPLDAINEAAIREKSIRHGHPSTLHLWWARRPLAAARAVLFAQLVNDPGFQQGEGFRYGFEKKKAAAERRRLFDIIEELVKWENTTNEPLLEKARLEIRRSWREVCDLNKNHPQADELFNPDNLPALHDPFAGGGAIPLEAQRLGLEAYASDLNPIAVLINKAMIEIPSKFGGRSPVNPNVREKVGGSSGSWRGTAGIAEDVHYYGSWIRTEARKRIGNFYPPVEITSDMLNERPDLNPLLGQQLTVIAWLWVRTVASPNPAFSHVEVPLASSFVLSSRVGKEAYVEPIVNGAHYRFAVKRGRLPARAKEGTTAGKRKAFRCLISDVPIDYNYIREQGKTKGLGQKLMAVVVDGPTGRTYLPPTPEMEVLANAAKPKWEPTGLLPKNPRDFKTPNYGLETFAKLFTHRQLLALTTFSDLVTEARERIEGDANLGQPNGDAEGLQNGGTGPRAYAEAISIFLAFAVDRMANTLCSIARWTPERQQTVTAFARQAVPMTWDFPEVNPFACAAGDFLVSIEGVIKGIPTVQGPLGHADQADAATQHLTENKIVSTDPPYYDNIGYADLSDFFYVWLRPVLRAVYPALFATLTVPKAEELVATPYRHGNKEKAEAFFLDGMTRAMAQLANQAHPAIPITIYYAFKQSETEDEAGTASTGWEVFLEAVNRSGLRVFGTWPIRTELSNRMLGAGNNALASSVILVCRKRSESATTVSRREFQRELNVVLPGALDEMTRGAGGEYSPVAPVDLSQAIIGPGMAVFSKYSAVLEADGSSMGVRTALQLINRFLAEDDFDHDTQFCLHWFAQHGWLAALYGDAEVLARAKGTSVDGVKQAGVIESGGGKVRLLKWSEYPTNWNPATDLRLPVWECLHHLIRAHRVGGDSVAGELLAATKQKAEASRQLAYRLYTLCERSGWADDARAYNELITSWSAIESAAGAVTGDRDLFGDSL